MDQIHWINICLAAVLIAAIAYQGKNILHLDEKDDFLFITSPLTSPSEMTGSKEKLMEAVRIEFAEPEVIKVTDKVYAAVGFAVANSIMIEGTDGIIIVDTTEGSERMEDVMAAFREISDKPVKAIILTHYHPDHITGANYVVTEEKKRFPDQKIELYAHETTKKLMTADRNVQDASFRGAARQFGALLPQENVVGIGIGKIKPSKKFFEFSQPDPTITYKDHATYTVAGITFETIFTPGETDDHTTILFPREGVVLTGDNIYKAFPNLYAIRGQPARDCKQWYQSLDKVRSLKAKYLVPGHTRPIIGTDAVHDTLTVYRDAIKYVHDQTLRYMNKGYLPEDIVRKVVLPDNLASHPYLQERYGTVRWSVRGVYTDYIGWFTQNAVDMEPMHSNERAARLADLVSKASGTGTDAKKIILQVAQRALQNSRQNFIDHGKHIGNDDKWALQLADAVLKLDDADADLKSVAKTIKVSALTALGLEHSSPNGRKYYLTSAFETEKGIFLERPKPIRINTWKTSPVESTLEMFCLKIKGLECQHKNFTLNLAFTDVERVFTVVLRNGVCNVVGDLRQSPNLSISLTSQQWASYLSGEVGLDRFTFESGSASGFQAFMECFDPMI